MASEVQILPAEILGNTAKVKEPVPTTGMHFIFVRRTGGKGRLRFLLRKAV